MAIFVGIFTMSPPRDTRPDLPPWDPGWTHRIEVGPADRSTIYFGCYGSRQECIEEAAKAVGEWRDFGQRMEALGKLGALAGEVVPGDQLELDFGAAP